MMKTILKNTVK